MRQTATDSPNMYNQEMSHVVVVTAPLPIKKYLDKVPAKMYKFNAKLLFILVFYLLMIA